MRISDWSSDVCSSDLLAVIGLFGITAVPGTLIYPSNQNMRTIVVPFGAGGDLYVTGATPSEAYMRTITRNVVSQSGTYSAYSADRQFQALLSIVHPSPQRSEEHTSELQSLIRHQCD